MGSEEVTANDRKLDLGDEEPVVNFLASNFDKRSALSVKMDWLTRSVKEAGWLRTLELVLGAWWCQGDWGAGVNKDALPVQRGA